MKNQHVETREDSFIRSSYFDLNSESESEQETVGGDLLLEDSFCHRMSSLPSQTKMKTTTRPSSVDCKLYRRWVQMPLKRKHLPEKLFKVIPPTDIPTISTHLEDLAFFETPMFKRYPIGSRSFFLRMRLRRIMDIEEDLKEDYDQHCNNIDELKTTTRRISGFRVAMMEGERMRKEKEIEEVEWVKLNVLCEMAVIQEEFDVWNAE